jgi:hypothetical protein
MGARDDFADPAKPKKQNPRLSAGPACPLVVADPTLTRTLNSP